MSLSNIGASHEEPPMEVAAVSAAASDSDVTVSAVGWHGFWHEKGHGKGKSGEKGKEKGEKGSNMIRGGQNRSVVVVCHCWKWGQKKAQCSQWQGRRPDGTRCSGDTSFSVCCF